MDTPTKRPGEKRLTLALDGETYKRMRLHAAKTDQTHQAILEAALAEYLKRKSLPTTTPKRINEPYTWCVRSPDGGEHYFSTNAEAWRFADKINNEAMSRIEDVTDWASGKVD